MSETGSGGESEKYRERCETVLKTLQQQKEEFDKQSRSHKCWHQAYSLVTVFGGVIGPAATAYILAGNSDAPLFGKLSPGWLDFLVIVIAASLGVVGSAQRIFAFGTKYITSARGLIDLEDAESDLSTKLVEWEGNYSSEKFTDLAIALRNAQKTMKKTRRSYLLAEMNIVEESKTEEPPEGAQNPALPRTG